MVKKLCITILIKSLVSKLYNNYFYNRKINMNIHPIREYNYFYIIAEHF